MSGYDADRERMIVAGMTVEDVASAMNVGLFPVRSIRHRHGGRRLIGRPPAYAALASDDRSVVVLYESEIGTPVPGFSSSPLRVMSDVLHELSHLMLDESFVDESSVAAWQALVITYLDPEISYELASDMEGYGYSWSGSPSPREVGDFEAWLRSPEFEALRQSAEQLGIVRGHEPVLRRINP